MDTYVSTSSRCSVSLPRWQRDQIPAARHKVSLMSLSDTSILLYTLVNGATGHVDGRVGLAALPSLNALFELDEISVDGFSLALEAGNILDMVVLGLDNELNS